MLVEAHDAAFDGHGAALDELLFAFEHDGEDVDDVDVGRVADVDEPAEEVLGRLVGDGFLFRLFAAGRGVGALPLAEGLFAVGALVPAADAVVATLKAGVGRVEEGRDAFLSRLEGLAANGACAASRPDVPFVSH